MATCMGAATASEVPALLEEPTPAPNPPINFAPMRLKYPLKKRNWPVSKLTKSTENGHKMVKTMVFVALDKQQYINYLSLSEHFER